MTRKTVEQRKAEIVGDLYSILKLPITDGMKKKVIHLATWAWSQLPGKISKANYWSKSAIESHKNKKKASLIFEHVVPRSVIVKMLLSEKQITRSQIKEILEIFCFGCVVTKVEDDHLNKNKFRDKMPDGWNKDDVWARYKSVNPQIEVQKLPHDFI